MRVIEHNPSALVTSVALTAVAIPVELAVAWALGAPPERGGALFLGLLAAGVSLGAWARLASRTWRLREYLMAFVACWAAWNTIAFVWIRLWS